MILNYNKSSLVSLSSKWTDFKILKKLFHRNLTRITQGTLNFSENDRNYTYGNAIGLNASIDIKHKTFYWKACLGGTLGIADSYADGDWESPCLTSLFRLFLNNQSSMDKLDKGMASVMSRFARWIYGLTLRNSVKGSKRNISLHYDLGNDFFQLVLDPTMTYSCGIFNNEDSTLLQASIAKYDRIINQLQLGSSDSVLEIGCGWGGFAIHAAQSTGCKITSTTISEEQYRFAKQRVKILGLAEQIKIIKTDYRNLNSQYDRIVSIEMIEAVGHEYLPTYFNKVSQLLKSRGAALIQAITMPDHRYKGYLKRVDYIRSRVFPGSCCPSVSAMINAATKNTDLRPSSLNEIGNHYVRTLQEWRKNFNSNQDRLLKMGYSESFLRSWDYYLCYCEAGFAEGYTNNVHLLLTKPNFRKD